jgi:hypothetical protein
MPDWHLSMEPYSLDNITKEFFEGVRCYEHAKELADRK